MQSTNSRANSHASNISRIDGAVFEHGPNDISDTKRWICCSWSFVPENIMSISTTFLRSFRSYHEMMPLPASPALKGSIITPSVFVLVPSALLS